MIKFLKAAPVVFLIGTMVTAILYQFFLFGFCLLFVFFFVSTAFFFFLFWMGGCIYLQFHHA